jgi:hypothetical protein
MRIVDILNKGLDIHLYNDCKCTNCSINEFYFTVKINNVCKILWFHGFCLQKIMLHSKRVLWLTTKALNYLCLQISDLPQRHWIISLLANEAAQCSGVLWLSWLSWRFTSTPAANNWQTLPTLCLHLWEVDIADKFFIKKKGFKRMHTLSSKHINLIGK